MYINTSFIVFLISCINGNKCLEKNHWFENEITEKTSAMVKNTGKCSWDKSLNIGTCLLRILLKVHSFTFDCLNRMLPMVLIMKCITMLSWDHVIQESNSGKIIYWTEKPFKISFKWSNVKEWTLRRIRIKHLSIFKLLSQLHSS